MNTVQIIEVTRNINIVSAFTSIVAAANLMFANVIGQGNRAAGKLASLRVSSSGVFSITDPGVSEFDQANIDKAQLNLADTVQNQVKFNIEEIAGQLKEITKPVTEENQTSNVNNVVINNSINLQELEGLTADEILDILAEKQTESLQENLLVN